jgi:hypothetical protein
VAPRLTALALLLSGCTVEADVLVSQPSRLCESGLETPSGEALVTGDACVDECLAATADAKAELDALAAVLTPQCVLLAEDLGLSDTWSEKSTPVEVMLEACTQAADVVRESGTAILCSTELTEPCTFATSCVTSAGSSPEDQTTAVLLETRLPGVLDACCGRSETQKRLGDIRDACTECGADPSVQTCVQSALGDASDLTVIMLTLASACGSFTIVG